MTRLSIACLLVTTVILAHPQAADEADPIKGARSEPAGGARYRPALSPDIARRRRWRSCSRPRARALAQDDAPPVGPAPTAADGYTF